MPSSGWGTGGRGGGGGAQGAGREALGSGAVWSVLASLATSTQGFLRRFLSCVNLGGRTPNLQQSVNGTF